MKSGIPIALALLGVFGIASSAQADDDRPEPLPIPPSSTAGETQELIRDMAFALGLGEGWVPFLEAAAMGESGLNPLVGRGTKAGSPDWIKLYPSNTEAAAAQKAYDRNLERFEGCTWDAVRYGFGSGGLWAQIPSNALVAFAGTPYICLDPWAVFEPRKALVMFLEMNRRLMGYSKFGVEPTWGNLRVGARGASRMGKATELERQRTGHNKLGDRYEQLGYDRALVDAPVTPLPARDPLGWLATLDTIA